MLDPRTHAIETVKDLAIQGRSFRRIERELGKLGLSGILRDDEIESIVSQAEVARGLMPPRPSRKWPRMLGAISILLGMIALPLGGGIGRYSPAGYGCLAIILGLVLVLRPDWSDTEMR